MPMESFSNISTSGLSFNSNETGLNYDLSFVDDFLSMNNPLQKQPAIANNVRTDTHTLSPVANTLLSSTNLTSQTSRGFSQSAVNNMLPTPESFDNNAPESTIISPYNMITDSGVFQDNQLFFEPLDSSSLAEPSGTPFMQNYVSVGPLSPHTSPPLPPDSTLTRTRHQSQKSINQNRFNSRYSPIIKQKASLSSNNNSTPQSRETNRNNINKNNSTNDQNDMTTNLSNIVTSSTGNSMTTPSLLGLTSSLNDIVSTSIAPSLQDTMPNLNLESNLVSSGMTMQPLLTSILSNESSSSFSDNIVPITPSSLMKMKIKQTNSLKSEQNKQISNDQLNPSSKIQPALTVQSQRTVMATTNGAGEIDLGLSHVIISPNVSTNMTSRMTSITTSPIISASPSGKSIRPNPNASSPLALGPSIHSKSPQTLKPLISPNLKPKLSGVTADEIAKQLANKSNYQSILEGTAQSLGISYPSDVHSSLESRRTTHKAAEQKRRDLLKQSFDELRKVVPISNEGINYDGKNTNDDDNGKSSDGSVKNVSKLSLLKRAHDHIVGLQQKAKEKDELIQKLRSEVDELKRTKKRKTEGSDEENSSDNGDTKN